jgi:hypothetical protein
MSTTANYPGYGNPGAGSSPWGPGPAPAWGYQDWGYWRWHSGHRGLGIVAMILGFILFWPLGLVILFYLIWSGRMGCWGRRRYYADPGAWQGSTGPGAGPNGPQGPGGGPAGGPGAPFVNAWRGFWSGPERAPQSSGNRAFDEYRHETLRRLEEEQREFGAFLDRLRFAKDKAEFDQFMTERRPMPPAPAEPPPHG